MKKYKRQSSKGFTLIEVVLVVTVMAILVAMIAPAIGKAKSWSQTAACLNNMRQIIMAAFMSAEDNNGIIPDVTQTAMYVQSDANVFICPRDTRPGLGLTKPSYTAWKYTPASLLPAQTQNVFTDRIIYLESEKAGIVDKSLIDPTTTFTDFAFRHVNKTVLIFGDGHGASLDPSRAAEMAAFSGGMSPGGGEQSAD